jgi:hypothetical protein
MVYLRASCVFFLGLSITITIGLAVSGCADFNTVSQDGGTEDASDGSYDGGGGDQEVGQDDDQGSDQDGDQGGDQGGEGGDCDSYISALVDCSYQLSTRVIPDACPITYCMDAPCVKDSDCPLAGASENGGYCVLGNCVFCWQDSQCQDDYICRGGRCIDPMANPCDNNPPCTDPNCRVVSISENACPVCVCDSVFSRQCDNDGDCQVISSYLYHRCVYGRCTDCRHDEDCSHDAQCLPPGLCGVMEPHPEVLYGTWLLGWAGGMDHFSYFRFEPDGTLRRGFYIPQGTFADDIPLFPCNPDEPYPRPIVGSWETAESSSVDLLLIRMSLNVPCDSGAGWVQNFQVTFPEQGNIVRFTNLDGDQLLEGIKVPNDVNACTPDFSSCQVPDWSWFEF